MINKKNKDFCIECREETEYVLKEEDRTRTVKDKEYSYKTLVAYCSKCGEEMSISYLFDYDEKAFDKQYRYIEELVSIKEIEKLMEMYKLGKSTLSLALGFGEITITRYLMGQMPSKRYSDIMKKASYSPLYMEKLLNENKEKIGETAYKKSMNEVTKLRKMVNISNTMLMTIAYIFHEVQEITPLALQKMLYFIQSIYMTIFNEELYEEECEAWIHGPVYSKVYNIFKDFKYNPIDDERFSLFIIRNEGLNENQKMVIQLVVNSFGMYSGKILEKITHKEKPWINARNGINIEEPSKAIISKISMKEYYKEVWEKYDIKTISGLKQYIIQIL